MRLINYVRITLLLAVTNISVLADNNITITGTRVSATCEVNASQETFMYAAWAGPCPFFSRAQALEFITTNDIVQDSLPTSIMPTNPPLGETLSIPNCNWSTSTRSRCYHDYILSRG